MGMKSKPVIAIAGATGVVGNEMLAVLEQLNIPCSELRLLASKDSVGELYKFHSDEIRVEQLDGAAFEGADVALFATSNDLAREFVPLAVEAGAVVIDNSSAFRLQPEIPLVVPEVNFEAIKSSDRIIANPNCSTIQLVPVLQAIHQAAGLRRVVVTTFQSVSGAGKAALDELWDQTLAIFNQREIKIEAFPHQIAFNCIPQIDVLMDDGYTREEFKIIQESRKILGLANLKITATAVRVPVFHGHAGSVNVETEKPLSPKEVSEILSKRSELAVFSEAADYPMQLSVAGTDAIQVGRIRRDDSAPNALNLWIVADNIRKGAALNAVQILQRLLPQH
ncbi:MAG: aspartate-semialdehyde dehydrogenase [Oligoflexia bacterium]|nr:aspartate-semialdehyde dehydrogenase [Oligoflexia bacterium]